MALRAWRLDGVENRTQELGRALIGRVLAYAPGPSERLQDGIMRLASREPRFRNSLLGFVDALASLDFDTGGVFARRLAREYFGRPFPRLPFLARLGLRLSTSVLPAAIFAGSARWLTRLIARRFIAAPGDGLDEAIGYLERQGRYGSFDILGEHIWSDAEADRYVREYLELIAALSALPAAGQRTPGGKPAVEISVKLTGLAANFNPIDPGGTFRELQPRFEGICQAARAAGIGVNIDVEQYQYRDLTWTLLDRAAGAEGPLTGWDGLSIVIQAYLRDSAPFVRRARALAQRRGAPLNVRLVRGAYWDYEVAIATQNGWPVPVFSQKGETDRSYEALVVDLLEAAPDVRLAVASHNLRSHAWAESAREALGLPPEAIEHQTLFRTAEATSRAIAAMGWIERDYVPIGELVPGMAYLVRRVLENSSQVGFLMQSRLSRDAASLLAPPAVGPGAPKAGITPPVPHPDPLPEREGTLGPQTEQEGAVAVFRNHPPAQLFRDEEREAFVAALARTRREWGRRYPLRLGGQEVAGIPVESHSPSHPEATPVAVVDFVDGALLARALEVAEEGLQEWRGVPLATRAATLERAAGLMASERNDLAAWIVHEGGKDRAGALADVDEAIDYLRFSAHASLLHAEEMEALYEPRGLVAAIPPWNFPLAIPCGMVSAALAAGNAVILKPAEQTPLVAWKLVDLLVRAGVPPKAVLCLPGEGETVGNSLVKSNAVDLVTFTGSRAVGVGIYAAAAGIRTRRGRLKRAITEMGGKNAIVVFPDADLDETVPAIIASAFGHSNQKCSACSRVLIHRHVFAHLRDRLVEAARSLPWGAADSPGVVLTPLIAGEAKARVLGTAAQVRGEGQVVLDLMVSGDASLNVRPLLVELDATAALSTVAGQEEIFGPVLALISFETEAEALALANSTAYGLTAGVFTRSPATIQRMVAGLEAGNIYVNRAITGARVGVEPFGGFKLSGTGPKAGGDDYLWAFLARRLSRDASGDVGGGPATAPSVDNTIHGATADLKARAVEPTVPLSWRAGALVRLRMLRQALERLGRVPGWEVACAAGHRLLERARALAEREPTVELPGQQTYLLRSMPRGAGLVVHGPDTGRGELVAMVTGPLAAGNGLVVAPIGPSLAETEALLEELWGAGVPLDALALWRVGPLAQVTESARRAWAFVLTDLGLEATRQIFAAAAPLAPGARHLTALYDLRDGPPTDGDRFLRQFVHEKTVAIRTLRHGAEISY